MLETVALTKNYGSRSAVVDFSHRFAPGKITSILGPSAAGKSTVLAMIAGLRRPDHGRVLWDGRDLTNIAPANRNFGLVLQNYALFPHLSVRENVEFGLRARRIGRAERRQRALTTLELARIGNLAERRVQEISGGEQQRVAIARALAIRPKVLLLDEPLSALDAKLRDDLRVELQRMLSELAITTLYVTHDQVEAMSLAHELVIVHEGRIEQTGAPMDLYQHPANSFVANFLGDSNVLPARIENGRIRFSFENLSRAADEGARCWAMIRPEAIELVGRDEADFSGIVESSTFLGNRLRLRLRVNDTMLLVDTTERSPIAAQTPVFLRMKREQIFTWPR